MKILLNTSFFFTPTAAEKVKSTLRDQWIPACRSCGESQPVCLKMSSEEGVERMAIQTLFESETEATIFLNDILQPMAADLTRALGANAFTCFSTMMDVIEL